MIASKPQRYIPKTWNQSVIQAASVSVSACGDAGKRLIGIDMLASDNCIFAHAHFDIDTARVLYRNLADLIAKHEAQHGEIPQ